MSDKTEPVEMKGMKGMEEMEEIEFGLEPTEEETITLKPRRDDDELSDDSDDELDELNDASLSDELNELMDDASLNDDDGNAQTVFNTVLNEKDKRLSEIIISNTLRGPLDFSVLQKMGFECVKKIVFQKRGGITRLQNLPKDLVVLECSQQALTTLGALPPHLEELDVADNRLTELDLASTPKLKKLQISNNHLTLLENLPADLEELYVDGNYLEELDLVNAQNLKVLHISRIAEYLIISHFPSASIVDFQHDNTAFSKGEGTPTPVKTKGKTRAIPYEDALNEYYEMKSRYEGSRKKCPNCEQVGGLLFSTDGKNLLALCGNAANPCSFKINLFRGKFVDKRRHREELEQQVLSVGGEIIRLNLDAAFEYLDETQTAARYTKLKEKRQLLTLEQERLIEPVTVRDEHEEQLQETQRQIRDIAAILKTDFAEYKQTQNSALLERIMDLQVRQYVPLLEKERSLKWDYTEAVIFGKKSGLDKSPQYGCRLVHYGKGEYVEDLLIGEKPSVSK